MNIRRLIFLILFFWVFIYWFAIFLPDLFSVTTGWKATNIGYQLQKNTNFLNQILKKEVDYKGKDIYKSSDEFIKMLPKYYFYLDRDELSDYKIKKFNLKSYKNKPMLHYYDNYSIVLMKFQDECKIVDTVVPENSSCIIEMDLNTILEGPNKNKFKKKKPHNADRYSLIIDSEHDAVLIPEKYKSILY